jgi:hypothetical protein
MEDTIQIKITAETFERLRKYAESKGFGTFNGVINSLLREVEKYAQ